MNRTMGIMGPSCDAIESLKAEQLSIGQGLSMSMSKCKNQSERLRLKELSNEKAEPPPIDA